MYIVFFSSNLEKSKLLMLFRIEIVRTKSVFSSTFMFVVEYNSPKKKNTKKKTINSYFCYYKIKTTYIGV